MRSSHTKAATAWISLYLLLTVLPIAIIFLGPKPPGRTFLVELSIGMAFMSLAMMCLQFALTARFQRLKEPFGSDVVYGFHRAISLVAISFIALHPLLLFFTELRPEVLVRLDLLNKPAFPRWGFGALIFLVVILGTSMGRKKFGITYEIWRRIHAVCAVGTLSFSVLHVAVENHYFGMPLKGSLWIGYTLLWICLLLWVRIFKPWLLLKRPYMVEATKEERGSAITIVLSPLGHSGFGFSPGQFGWFSFFASPFSDKEHPFSFSGSSEEAPKLTVTAKKLGDFTERLTSLEVGDIAYVDGPFGAITADRHRHAAGFVMIAGGIGITPMISHIRSFADRVDKRPLILIYANNDWEDVTFREELEELQGSGSLKIHHVLSTPPDDWTGEVGFVNEELLKRLLPPAASGYEYLLCGPPPMMVAVTNSLVELGVDSSDVHAETFDLV